MEKTIAISNAFIKAQETGPKAVSVQVSGVVGMDFTGMDLARFVQVYSEEGYDVRIELDSVGGFASDAFAFYDQIRAKGLKLYVDGYGMVASAATVIMAAAGRKRSRLGPNAEYLVHNASGADAESLKRANSKMADIYVELTGKDKKAIMDLMKQDKPMGAEDARKWGFVGSIIELQKLAAKADKTTEMEENTKTARVFALSAEQRLTAALKGEVELQVDINAEAAEQITAYAEEVKGLKAKADELEAEVTAKSEAVDAVKAEVVKVEEERDALKATAEAAAKEIDSLKAEIEALKKTPIAKAAPKASAEVVEPAEATKEEFKPETKAEQAAKLRAYVDGLKKPKNTK